MERRSLFILLALLLASLLFFGGTALAQQPQRAASNHTPPANIAARPATAYTPHASRRISIPYGFADHMPLAAGETITASGHGSCTAGQEVTVEVTLTQTASSATGHGQMQQACAGESVLQTWEAVVTADQYSTFVDGAATACGVATTRDSGGVIQGEPYEWCKAVTLNWQIYLPALAQ